MLDEYAQQASLYPDQRGYAKQEADANGGRQAENVKLDVKVFPIAEPKGDTLAFASVALDDTVAIRGVRVVNSEKGQFVSMPQSKDKNGEYHDVAFPLSGDLRKAISNAVLTEYRQPTAKKSKVSANGSPRARNSRRVRPRPPPNGNVNNLSLRAAT